MSAISVSDQQAALELSRIINTNARRKSVTPPQSRPSLPRLAKRTQTNEHLIPITPRSMKSTPPQPADTDRTTSPLSSPPTSEASKSRTPLSGDASTSQYETPMTSESTVQHISHFTQQQCMTPIPKAGRKRMPQGLTDISISEGDLQSQPAPGPELFQMVEEAKGRGELPKICNSSVVRLIDGKWLAPQMCQGCQQDLRASCDRQSPCSSCANNHTMCESDGFMVKLRGGLSKNLAKASDGISSAAMDSTASIQNPLTHSHVLQDSDGSWSNILQLLPGESHMLSGKQPRKARSSGRVKQRVIDVTTDQEDNSELVFKQPKPLKLRGRKRKVDDDEFSPGPEPAENPDEVALTNEKQTRNYKSLPKIKRARTVAYTPYHVNAQLDKFEPHGQPKVWAERRQGLCETLPYYAAYQSGAYMSDGVIYGFLVDAQVDNRDKFDDQIVISSVGGGRSPDENGKMARTKDQVKSPFAAGFMRNKEQQLPIAVIAGQGNRLSPSKLPHYYNVLDWFHVTDVWVERAQGMMTWKVRLEKINLAEQSWWAVKGSSFPPQDVDCQRTKSEICSGCNQPSKLIYNAGWACLNAECSAFFQFENGYDDAKLDYNKSFLEERTAFTGKAAGSIVPSFLTDQDMTDMDAFGIEKEFKRGIVCPKCGCCSRRIAWDHWSCENRDCKFTHFTKQRPMAISEVVARSIDVSTGGSNDFADGGIRVSQKIQGLYDVDQYIIPGEAGEAIGFVRHFKSNGLINQQKDGPNDLFLQMQEGKFDLKRNAARQKDLAGEILTSHWAANWGAPYKYGVSQVSKSFHDAPDVILKAVMRLTWAGEHAVTDKFEPFQPFNECLSIGYYEETKIGYHDDGEKELGPTVATLSLGARATMLFRPKAKSKIGTNTGKRNAKGTKPAVLKITLEHGDLMVMHGREIQQYYEHCVTPHGKLRFALTCRYVRPEMIGDDNERLDAIEKGSLPSICSQYNYDGDLNAKPIVSKEDSVAVTHRIVNDFAAKIKSGELTVSQVQEINDGLSRLTKVSAATSKGVVESQEDVAMSAAT